MFSRVGSSVARTAVRRAAPVAAPVRKAAVPRVQARFMSDAAAGEGSAAQPKSFFDKLPRDPNYEGFTGVVRYYLPTNDKVCSGWCHYNALRGCDSGCGAVRRLCRVKLRCGHRLLHVEERRRRRRGQAQRAAARVP